MFSFLEGLIIQCVNGTMNLIGGVRIPRGVGGDGAVGHVIWPLPSGSRPVPISLSGSRMKHVFLAGSSGSGKSVLLRNLVTADIHSRHPFISIDLSGDFNDTLLPIVAERETPETVGDRLWLLDLNNVRDLVVPYNPLQSSDPEEATRRALHTLSALRRLSEGWGVTIDEALRNAFCALAEAGACLTDTEMCLTDDESLAAILSHCTDDAVLAFFQRYSALPLDKRQALYSACLNKLTPLLAARPLRIFFGSRAAGYSLRTLIDDTPGLIGLVSLGVDRYQDAAHMVGGMVLNQIQQCFMDRIDRPESERRPVHLYIDECQRLDPDRIDLLFSNGRRFRVGVTVATQSFTALEAGLRSSIRSNCYTQIYFANSRQECVEMAKEFNSDQPRDVLEGMLAHQPVGMAFVCRRSEPTVQMRVLPNLPCKASAEAVEAIRQASLRRYGRARADIQAEMAARRPADAVSGLPHEQPAPVQDRPIKEVRRGKGRQPGQFRPDAAGEE